MVAREMAVKKVMAKKVGRGDRAAKKAVRNVEKHLCVCPGAVNFYIEG